MGPVDIICRDWEKETFGNGPLPPWSEEKQMFADFLVKTRTKAQIWRMLCGPATHECNCKCMCAPGIAWNAILAREKRNG